MFLNTALDGFCGPKDTSFTFVSPTISAPPTHQCKDKNKLVIMISLPCARSTRLPPDKGSPTTENSGNYSISSITYMHMYTHGDKLTVFSAVIWFTGGTCHLSVADVLSICIKLTPLYLVLYY